MNKIEKLNAIAFRFFIGCSCYISDSTELLVIEGVNVNLNMILVNKRDVAFSPSVVKPILRKFESLSRHEIEQLNKLWPHESITRTVFGSIQLDAEIISYLTSLCVDVFGWIDKGLAIDAAYNSIGASHS